MSEKISIQPMLTVKGGARAVAFYEAAFGATVTYRIDDPDGNVVARLAIGGAEFWVNDGEPEPLREGTFRVVLVVPDPDAVFERAVAVGAKEIAQPSDAHGWRTGRLQDPFGHYWEIGKPLGE